MKWTYDEFYKHVTILESKVRELQGKMAEVELTTLQHRKALSGAVAALEQGITESPIDLTPEMKQEWERSKHVLSNKSLNQLPY